MHLAMKRNVKLILTGHHATWWDSRAALTKWEGGTLLSVRVLYKQMNPGCDEARSTVIVSKVYPTVDAVITGGMKIFSLRDFQRTSSFWSTKQEYEVNRLNAALVIAADNYVTEGLSRVLGLERNTVLLYRDYFEHRSGHGY